MKQSYMVEWCEIRGKGNLVVTSEGREAGELVPHDWPITSSTDSTAVAFKVADFLGLSSPSDITHDGKYLHFSAERQ